MQDRRQVLKTAAAGTSTALATGTAPAALAGRVTAAAVETGFRAETTGGFLVLDGESASGENSLVGRIDLDPGMLGTVDISGQIYDDDTWEATSVAVPDLTDLLASMDLTTPIEGFIEELSVTGLLDSLDLDQIVVFIADIVDGLDLTQDEVDSIVGLVTDLIERFDVGVSQSILTNFLRNFLQNPDPRQIQNILDLFDIQSIEDILDLAGVTNLDQLEVILQGYLADLDIPQLLGEGSIDDFLDAAVFDIGVTGLSGEFDREQGRVTATPEELTIALGFQNNDFIDASLPLEITLTTGASGALTGSTDGLAGETGTARLVNNEFVLGLDALALDDADLGTIISRLLDTLDTDLGGIDIGSILADLDLGGLLTNIDLGQTLDDILTDKPGRHFVALDLAFDFDATPVVPGTITGQVIDSDGTLVPGATVRVLDPETGTTVTTTVAGGDGIYTLSLPPGEYELVADAAGRQFSDRVSLWGGQRRVVDATLPAGPPALPGLAPPQDRDGDGLYEHVRGESEVTVLDVQTLFAYLDSDAIQQYASSYNFSGRDPTEVTVLDVQALFNSIR
jgi:hypothetical protein